MASTILLDGQLTDWTRVDRLDFSSTSVDGFKVYGRVVDGIFHFALESSTTSIDALSTMWLNTDQNVATGHKIWGDYLGADYKIEFENDLSGVRPVLYSLDAAGNGTLVEGGLSFARSADGKIVELAIDKAKIGNATEISTVLDINDSIYLPNGYYKGQYTLNEEVLPVRTDPTLKVAIVFSETSAAHAFSDTAYSQLIMAAQSQAIAAGIPFDILTEQDLTNLSKVVNYDAIVFPSFGFVQKGKASAIEDVLTKAVFKYGISLVAAGDFMTNDETGAVLGTDPYARMKALLGVERVGGGDVDQITVAATGTGSAAVIGYENEVIRTYSQDNPAKIGTSYFNGVEGSNAQVLATQATSDGTKNAVLTTQTGGNNVFFATEGMLADSNMLQHAIGWAARPDNAPELKLQMGRQTSIFAARNDMDQSQEYADVKGDSNGGIYDKLIPILLQWKAEFDFVGSYYVNIGSGTDSGTGDQRTDWSLSKPFYDQLLAMGNEIGTHSYTHPEDTNAPSVDLQFEFEQSKKVLEEKLGIDIKGAAVPGAPESLETSQKIAKYFEYMTGGYTGVGAGYPSAFGYLTPGSESIYLAPNIKFDFSLVEAAEQYGGGMTADEAKAEWIKEFNELSMKSDMPVFVWPWHDYGPTQWMVNAPDPSPYTLDMYSDFLRYAHQQDTEFVTMLDLAQRIKAFEQAKFNYSFDNTSNTITATVTANQIGTFALDLEGHKIASVSGWYAYDDDSVFLDTDGGNYTIKLGDTPVDVTHITALPSRAQLLSITGDGLNLDFSIKGEGKIAIDLANPEGRQLVVTGADIEKRVGDKLELKVVGDGAHTISIKLDQLTAPVVALKEDTGSSLSDNISSNGELSVTGIATGATIEYSLDGNTWANSFAPVEGTNTVYVRQKDAAGVPSAASSFAFTLDRVTPTSTIDLPSLNDSGEATVTITFDEIPSGFDPDLDLDVVGGKLTDVTADSSGKVFTGKFKVFSNFEGFASVSLKANSYTDKAGNVGGVASDQVEVDTKGPTVASITLSKAVLKAGETALVTIVFSEKVAGLSDADVSADNGTLSNLASADGGQTWTAVFTPAQDTEASSNTVKVLTGYTDFSGNVGAGASSTSFAVDSKAPTASIDLPALSASGESTVTITFSEVPEGILFADDLEVVGGTLANLVADAGGKIYTGTFKALAGYEGLVSITLKAGSYTDAAGNNGHASSAMLGVDTKAPTSTVEMTPLDARNTSAVTITFSEFPEGFDPTADLEVVGGELTDVAVDVSGKVYTGTFKAFAGYDDIGSVTVKSGSYTDRAGNAGGGSHATVGVDTRAPTVTSITLSKTFLRAGESAAVTIIFSEKVTGFTEADVTAESGTLSNLMSSDGGKTWKAVFIPVHNVEDATNIIKVTGAYADQAGNAGGSASSGNYAVDTKSPTVSITQAKLGSSNKVLATFTFSEAVDPSTFTAQDVVLTGAKMESLTHVSGNTFTAVLTPLLSGNGQISVNVNNATYADLAGNAGTGAFKAFGATQAKATKGADWLVGTNGNNTLKGGSGDDIIRGGKGNDTISGDGGKDLLDFSDGRKGIKITLSQENSKYTTFDGRSAGLGIDKYRDMEGVIGTKYADTITGSSSADTLAGLGGNDVLRGGKGNDVFVFETNGGRDRIMDFEDTGKRHDKLDVRFFDFDVTSSSFGAWKADHVKQQGSHTIVSFDASSSVTLMNIKAKAIGFDDFLF